jgi:hypothetical protein
MDGTADPLPTWGERIATSQKRLMTMPYPNEDRCDRPTGEPTTSALLAQSTRLLYLSRIAGARSVVLAEKSAALMRRARELVARSEACSRPCKGGHRRV